MAKAAQPSSKPSTPPGPSYPLDDEATAATEATEAPGEGGSSTHDAEFPDVAGLAYEAARDELSSIVARLEGGQVPLEEGMRLWRRGEALAAHCTSWLDGAQRQISEAGPA